MKGNTVLKMGLGKAGFALSLLAVSLPAPAVQIFQDVGALAGDIQDTVDAFRAALGDPNNGNAPGTQPNGRREINWDGGGGNPNAAFGGTPFDVFRARGARFVTPGTGFFQSPPSGGPQNGLAGVFGNPTYADTFGVFSPLRLFTPVGSNITEGIFFVPGSSVLRATLSGFGVVFTDVDVLGSSRIEFFDVDDILLASQDVLPGPTPNQSLSFLGAIIEPGDQRIARVRITSGAAALGPNDVSFGGASDIVAMDDFLFGEPLQVPAPATLTLLGLGLAGLGMSVQRRKRMAE